MTSEIDKAAVGDPIADPGLPEHQLRPQDVDPKQERRTERQIATMFGLATVLLILFVVSYFTVSADQTFLYFSAQNVAFGFTLGGALLLMGVGIIQWAKKLMGDHEIVEIRHELASPPEDRAAILDDLNKGIAESTIGRRPLIRWSLIGALATLGLPAIVMLRDLGPAPYGQAHTIWRKGMRVVNDVSGEPIRPGDLEVGQLVNAEPDAFYHPERYGLSPADVEGTALLQAKAKAATIIVRMRPEDITPSKGRENWGIDGILCYSKICTHVGCPISLWEQQTHHLLCPCHQSTFDLADNGKVIFGPAGRPLPQLPLGIDADGYIIAMQDFPDIVAPAFPELERDQKKLNEANAKKAEDSK